MMSSNVDSGSAKRVPGRLEGRAGTPTYFFQECRACGRPLQVRVEYLGREVACGHCGCRLLACETDIGRDAAPTATERADQLLNQLDSLRARTHRSRGTDAARFTRQSSR